MSTPFKTLNLFKREEKLLKILLFFLAKVFIFTIILSPKSWHPHRGGFQKSSGSCWRSEVKLARSSQAGGQDHSWPLLVWLKITPCGYRPSDQGTHLQALVKAERVAGHPAYTLAQGPSTNMGLAWPHQKKP